MSERLPFLKELESLINRYSKENDSDTPDFILAMYLGDCLKSYESAVKARDKWFNVDMWKKDIQQPIANSPNYPKDFSKSIQNEMEKLNKKT